MDIIDFHVHPELEDPSFRMANETVRLARKHGIKRVCLLGDVLHFGYNPSREQIKKINNQTIAMVEKWPDFFYGFCFLNPKHSEKFLLSEVNRCLANENFRGIKLEVALNAADSRMDRVMRIAAKMHLVVVQHSWNTEIIGKSQNQSDPEDVACLARRFPQVKIVMAHITSATQRGVLAIRECRNVWTDTSGGQPVSGTIEYALEKLGPERIIFGSDVPIRDFPAQIGKIYGARISAKDRQAILLNNAKRLLGIK